MKFIERIISKIGLALLLIGASANLGHGQDAPPGADAPKGDSSRPLLNELDAEVRSLYVEVQAGIARVQMPTPGYLRPALGDSALNQYNLDRKTLLQLEQSNGTKTTIAPCTMPTGVTMTGQTVGTDTQPPMKMTMHWGVATSMPANAPPPVEPKPGMIFGQGQGVEIRGGPDGQVRVLVKSGLDFAPNNVGLVLDAQGHVLVPLYVEKEVVPASGVRLLLGGPGQPVMAKFVGSDRQTNITIFQLDKPAGTPVKLSDARLAEGSMVLILSPNNGSGRLAIWTGGQQDYGVVVGMDGSVMGFSRYGQFLASASCKSVIKQLIDFGVVRRAALGIAVQEVNRLDPIRVQMPALGAQPALRVSEVTPGSAAEAAGIQSGDLILSLEDQPVGDTPTFAAAIAARSGKTSMKILRANVVQTVTVDMKRQ